MSQALNAITLIKAELKGDAVGGLIVYKDDTVNFNLSDLVEFYKASGEKLTFPTVPVEAVDNDKTVNFYSFTQNGLAHTSDYQLIDISSGAPVLYSLDGVDSTKTSLLSSTVESLLSDNISKPSSGRNRLAVLASNGSLLTLVKIGTKTRSYVRTGVTAIAAPTYGDALKDIYVVIGGVLRKLNLRSDSLVDPVLGQSIGVSSQPKSVSCGLSHTLFLSATGAINGFGDNDLGQLGDDTFVDKAAPVAVGGALVGKTITKFLAAGYRSMALCSDGTLYGWGDNAYGQCGNGSTGKLSVPTLVVKNGALAGKTISDFAISANHTLILCSNGDIVSFGYNADGQLGNGTAAFSTTKLKVNYPSIYAADPIVSLAAHDKSSAVCTQGGKLIVWGNGSATPTAIASSGSIVYRDHVRLSSDAMPVGLALSTDDTKHGMITGAPTAADDYSVIIRAELTDFEYFGQNDPRNAHTAKGSTYFSLPIGVANVPTVIPPLSSNIIGVSDRSLTAGKDITIPLKATVETAAVVEWAVAGLPQGMSTSITGTESSINGTPVETGDFSVGIALKYKSSYNGQILTSTKTVTFSVAPAVVPSINLQSRTIQQGAQQTILLTASDLFKAEEWQISPLPAGLSLTPSGSLTGAIGPVGTYPMTITLLYKFSEASPTLSVSKSVTFTVTQGIPELSLSSVAQEISGTGGTFSTSATTSRPFNIQVNASNNPTSFTAVGLPNGFEISSAGVISGVPTTAGVYAVTLTASNAIGTSPPKYLRIDVAEVAVPAFLSNGGIDLFVDLQTRKLALSPPKPETTLAAGSQVVNQVETNELIVKSGENLLINVRFTKGTTSVDPDPGFMRFGVATKLGAPLIMESNTFTKFGSGSSAYFRMKASSVAAEFGSLINDYYDEDSVEQVGTLGGDGTPSSGSGELTDITGICELLMTVGGEDDMAEIRSDTMKVIVKRSLL
jgi:hypothetical protein